MLKRLSYVIVALFFCIHIIREAKTVKILSLSGGGTRGIMEAEYLAQLEESTGKSIRSLFDVIVGTSTVV
jgi:patatin-like phospholipase/acyl hydrolase